MKQERQVQAMKNICNMSIGEAKQAFDKWTEKHCINDKFEMGGLQLTRYAGLLERANREELLTLISDIFNHGFMAGYKQSEADTKAKIDKRIYNEEHRRLLELVYYLPLGYQANFFYHVMIFSFDDGMIEALYPKRIAKPALEIIAEHKAKEAREKAEREERKKVVDEALKQYEQRNKTPEEQGVR